MYYTTDNKLKTVLCSRSSSGLALILCFILLMSGCAEQSLQEHAQDGEIQGQENSSKESTGQEKSTKADAGLNAEPTTTSDSQIKNIQEKTISDTKPEAISERLPVKAEIIENWTLTQKGNFMYVNGSLVNTGDNPIGFFRIKAEYVSDSGQVVDTESTVYNNVVWPNHHKRFEISNKYNDAYESVRIWIDEVEAAKQPVVYIEDGLDAEIVPDWTWTVDGAFTHVEGSLRNTGNKTIRYFKIIAEYEDQKGHVLDSTFTNSNNQIEPGDALKFTIMHPYDEAFKRVTIYISRLE